MLVLLKDYKELTISDEIYSEAVAGESLISEAKVLADSIKGGESSGCHLPVRYLPHQLRSFISEFFRERALAVDGFSFENIQPVLEPRFQESQNVRAYLESFGFQPAEKFSLTQKSDSKGFLITGAFRSQSEEASVYSVFGIQYDGGIKVSVSLTKLHSSVTPDSIFTTPVDPDFFSVTASIKDAKRYYGINKRGAAFVAMDSIEYSGARFVYGIKSGQAGLYVMESSGLRKIDLQGHKLRAKPEEIYANGLQLMLRTDKAEGLLPLRAGADAISSGDPPLRLL